MKKMKSALYLLSCMLLFLLLPLCHFGQTVSFAETPKIEVTGSAEMYLVPDEIKIAVTLQEYKTNPQAAKVPMANVEEDFFAQLQQFGLGEKNLELSDRVAWSQPYYVNGESKEELQYKKYTLRIDSTVNLYALMSALNQPWMDDVKVVSMTNKQETAFRKAIKIKAIQEAKAKAGYLLEAIDERVGQVLSVTEIQPGNWWSGSSGNALSNTLLPSSGQAESSDLEAAGKIKLRYEVQAVFAIK